MEANHGSYLVIEAFPGGDLNLDLHDSSEISIEGGSFDRLTGYAHDESWVHLYHANVTCVDVALLGPTECSNDVTGACSSLSGLDDGVPQCDDTQSNIAS